MKPPFRVGTAEGSGVESWKAVRFPRSDGLSFLIKGPMTMMMTGGRPCLLKWMIQGLCLGLAVGALPAAADEAAAPSAVVAAAPLPAAQASTALSPQRADFDGAHAPDDVRQMADWVVASKDNQGVPFVIVEKPQAVVFVFDAKGHILGTAPCLVGLQPGDDSVPGVGTMTLAQITPDMRTTPAGRFVAALGHDLGKTDVLWVDYPNAISLHRVVNNVRSERRPERLASPDPHEHRISWGCINVPAKFFDKVVQPAFTGSVGIVYILPEIKSMHDVFPKYHDVDQQTPLQSASATPSSIEAAGQ